VIDLLALLRGQVAILTGAIVADFTVEVGFARFKILGFSRSERARVDAVGNAALLVLLPLARGRSRLIRLALLSNGRTRSDQGGPRKRKKCALHIVSAGAPLRIPARCPTKTRRDLQSCKEAKNFSHAKVTLAKGTIGQEGRKTRRSAMANLAACRPSYSASVLRRGKPIRAPLARFVSMLLREAE
jgi:hypothetical protein